MRLLFGALLVLPAFGARAAALSTTIYSFQTCPEGANPVTGLVRGSDGYFYGTTSDYGLGSDFAQPAGGRGGASTTFPGLNPGTLFRISTNGVITTLYSFTGGKDGAKPDTGLVEGSDGYFYGTTQGGGTNGAGTVFKISVDGALTTLYAFGTVTNASGDALDGAQPQAALLEAGDGFFYGTTSAGGTRTNGTVFRITTNGLLTSLYSFTGGKDGATPVAGLVDGGDGYFYGTTTYGGTDANGTVFKISANGALTTLYSFTGGEDGANPQGGLARGGNGYFYGTTTDGGSGHYENGSIFDGLGTVFKITTNGVLTSLYSFTGGNDGAYPYAGLTPGSDGYFYGTTDTSVLPLGFGDWPWGPGTAFKISTNGVLTTLSTAVGNPQAGLALGSDGYFYGTDSGINPVDGPVAPGAVFKISANGGLIDYYPFGFEDAGAQPSGRLVAGGDGYFYGTTQTGGAAAYFYPGFNGDGTVFRISADGLLTTLYSFGALTNAQGGALDGANPVAGLVRAGDGSFYGTTEGGGVNGNGTVFKFRSDGALTSLYSFGSITNAQGLALDGASPSGGLVEGDDGYFYGTTQGGGTNNVGTVFRIGANGAITSLYSFTGGNDGAKPDGGLLEGADGYFYGTTGAGGIHTNGTVFKISANGMLTSLYSFTGGNDGANPQTALVSAGDGNIYGTTVAGGAYGGGTVFQISANGTLASLYSFSGGADGRHPNGLVEGSDGNFYGTTEGGAVSRGLISYGSVFAIGTNGVLTTLYSFSGGNDGGIPEASLAQGGDGRFYGTTSVSGDGLGTVFRLTIVPEFQAVTRTNGGLSLTWSTEAGGTYQLQANSDLSSTHWVILSGLITATGSSLNFTDSLTNASQRFYRLALAP